MRLELKIVPKTFTDSSIYSRLLIALISKKQIITISLFGKIFQEIILPLPNLRYVPLYLLDRPDRTMNRLVK
jgi:hypothetical protein